MSASSQSSLLSPRLFFYTDSDHVDSIMKKGIWYSTPSIETVKPLDSSSIFLIDKNENEIIATDMKVKKCVHLHGSLFSKLESQNLASVFILEIDAKLMNVSDFYTIKRIGESLIGYLKNYMVDRCLIKSIYVFSDLVKTKLQKHLNEQGIRTTIRVAPSLFGQVDDQSKINEDFVIKKDEVQLAPTSSVSLVPVEQPLIAFKKGNLLLSSKQTLVNTVNCVGVMGKGIAFSFKHQFPKMFEDYSAKCKNRQVELGKPYLYTVSAFCIVVNFPTKGHWRESSKIENIETGLQYLLEHAKEWGIQSMAIPPLGCGNGGLNWDDVKPLMIKYLSQLNIPVDIYAPHEEAAFELPSKRQRR